jgi:hypothetical protein
MNWHHSTFRTQILGVGETLGHEILEREASMQ